MARLTAPGSFGAIPIMLPHGCGTFARRQVVDVAEIRLLAVKADI
jgi:hypothetical protein